MGEFVDVSKKTILSMIGSDCLDFLQRISTNDVSSIRPGQFVQTVLTNEKGRIVDLVTIINKVDGHLLLLGESETSGLLKSWIERYIIMENIKCEEVTDKHAQVLLYGSEIISRGRFFESPPDGILVAEEAWRDCKRYRVVADVGTKEFAERELSQLGFLPSSRDRYDEFRIQHCIPAAPNELSVSYNPLEAGLGHLISWTKGCYIGQEVIARLDTYKKVQKTLVRLTMDEVPLALPVTISRADSECGTITSARKAFGTEKCIGLGYLRTGADANGGSGFSFHEGEKKVAVAIER